jgi:hypothetical protein
MRPDGQTRGEANRNPGNLEREPEVQWLGMSADQGGDARFCIFDDMLHGMRALMRLLLFYQRHHGDQTVRQVIDRWAPPSENDANSYVFDVASRINVRPDEILDLGDADMIEVLALAIVHHENGRVLPEIAAVASAAAALALA